MIVNLFAWQRCLWKVSLVFLASASLLACETRSLKPVPLENVEIGRETVDRWSAPYRNWYYYPDPIISATPDIEGFEEFGSVDCPTVYQIPGEEKWRMSFIAFDGNGYQSFVAESGDLVHWRNMRLAMGFGPADEFDHGGRVLGAYLYESYDIQSPRVLKKYKDKFWSLYGAYPKQGGYELRPGYEGVANSEDGLKWQRAQKSYILSVHDRGCGGWEKDCIYQPWLVEENGRFYDFYNAAHGSVEQTGIAFSNNLLSWKRYANNPVIRNATGGYDEQFCSDPKVFRDGDHWIMFYFGVGKGGAHIMAAFSRDLIHWTAHPEPLYKAGGNPSGLDRTYAHKISLVYNPQNQTYYMYYCAVGDKGRGIGLITSKPLGAAKAVECKIKPAVSGKVQPFALEDVRLFDSPFKKAMELDGAYLLKIEPDHLLAGFRESKGLQPKAEKYAGWEGQGIAGHTLGHYLSACSMMYASTGDSRFLERVNYIVSELEQCQEDDGYVAAIPNGKKVFAEIAAGNIHSAGFDLNGCWVPWYTLHKLFAGLLDAQRYCENSKALSIAARLADWAIGVTANLDEAKFQTMLACEHGGMNESLAELYARTGERKYLDLSLRFHHKAILDPLAKGVDCLPGKHANTQIPKIIGLARRYEIAGAESDRDTADFFWNAVVHDHTYVIGGNSFNEHFGPPRKLTDRLGPNTTETCNTYNMLKLTRHLFEWRAEAEYADYYERALYNHILASQNPADGMMCYYLPLMTNGFKAYNEPFDSFWCCTGSGMENHAKYGDSIYFHDADGLYVNLFIPSLVTWAEKEIQICQQTRFPEEDTTRLAIFCRQPTAMPIRIHCPYWAESGMTVKLNGNELPVESHPGSYAVVDRTWNPGDVLEITLPMSLRLEAMPDNPKRAAILYGPVVLAGDLGPEEQPPGEGEKSTVFITENKPVTEWIQKIPNQPLAFQTSGVGRPQDVSLIPLYKMHHRRYGVYWDLFTEADWQKREAEYRAEQARLQKLEARTIDMLRIGEMQPERDHNLQGEKTAAGDFMGRKWRHASDGGWFSFELKITGNEPLQLMCTYWGSDSGGRMFDVLVDGVKVATQTLNNKHPGKFFDEIYALPKSLIRGKEKITVRLQARPGQMAGGLFGCRVLKK